MTTPAEHAATVRETLDHLTIEGRWRKKATLAALTALEAQIERQGQNIHALYKQKRKAEKRVEELEAALRELLDGAREMDNPMNTVVSTSDIEDARAALDKDTALAPAPDGTE